MKGTSISTMAIGLALSLIVPACNPNKKESSKEIAKKENHENFETRDGEKEADFVVDAVAGNYAEIRLAQLAVNRSSNPEIKEIAGKIEKNHAKVLTELKGFANKKGIAIPLEEDEAAKDNVADLAKKDRSDFDITWCKQLVQKHERTIQKYESMWEKTQDPDLKEWINRTLPDLRMHLVKLNSCEEKLTIAKRN